MDIIEYISFALLAVGLYASVYGIEHMHLRNQIKHISALLFVGIFLKTAIIMFGLWALFDMDLGYAWLFSLALAQIDPIGTAKYITGNTASRKVQSILRTVSSFDDPITVILTIVGIGFVGVSTDGLLGDYALSLAKNAAFALGAIGLYRAAKDKLSGPLLAVFTVAAFALTIWQQLFLGIAVIALFVRPKQFAPTLPKLLHLAFFASVLILLPLIELNSEDVIRGVALGLLGYGAQIIAGFLLTHGMKWTERKTIMFAQFNGITSVILALFLSTQLGDDVFNIPSIIAFAVLTVDVLYLSCNRLFRG